MLNATKARLITPDKQNNWTVTDQLALTFIFAVDPSSQTFSLLLVVEISTCPSPGPAERVHLRRCKMIWADCLLLYSRLLYADQIYQKILVIAMCLCRRATT